MFNSQLCTQIDVKDQIILGNPRSSHDIIPFSK
jgi:hypothetical protein